MTSRRRLSAKFETVTQSKRYSRSGKVGVILETESTVNPDGSITVNLNQENTRFEGFINYGSGIFTSGIPGAIPNLITPPQGCRFHPRCAHAGERCRRERPHSLALAPGHSVACHLYDGGVE